VTWSCLWGNATCWPIDPPAAGVVWLATIAFIVCVTCVMAGTLPGRAAARLGKREGTLDRAAVLTGVIYVAWVTANVGIAAGLWAQLFPSAAPVTLVYDRREASPMMDCANLSVRDLRCVFSAAVLEASGDADGIGDAARLLIDHVRHPAGSPALREAPPAAVDVAAYAALMTMPVADVVLVGTAGTDPANTQELATQGWPWVARWIARFQARGRHVVADIRRVSTPAEVPGCVSKPRSSSIPTRSVLIRFCLLPPASGQIEAVIDVRLHGADVLVEVRGRGLPGTGFATIDGIELQGALSPVAGTDRAMLRLIGSAARARGGRLLEVGVTANAMTHTRALGFAMARPWCLVVEGDKRDALVATREAVKSAFSESRRPMLTGLDIRGEPCPHGTLYLATNGTVLAGTDLTVGSAQALASELAPDGPMTHAFRPRVLDPLFDAAPGLLDDVRLGQRALRHGAFVVSPLVVREAAFTGPTSGLSDPGLGFADFVEGRLVDPAVPLAAIVAWVEGGPAGTSPGRVLAGSFGEYLWSSDPITRQAAWGALVSMREAGGLAAPVSLAAGAVSLDHLGVAVERVVDEDRQRRLYAALGGWLLLMFLMRWGAR
jgi:hypothetical protein